jgi:hypothetical protein
VRSVRLALALLASVALRSAGQARPDTAVTVHGFLESADSGGWGLVLPDPLVVDGRRVNLLTARGDDARWPRMRHRFVRAVGRVELASAKALMQVERLQEAEPEGARRATVHLSFNQTAVVMLAAIPNRFAWRLSDGRGSGVQPMLMYTILNHGQTEIDFRLPTNEILCARVRRAGDAEGWSTALPSPTHNQERIVIRLGGVYRHFVPIPPEAAPAPGRYVAHVTLCGIADYGVETPFEVGTP